MDKHYVYWCNTENDWIFEWSETEPTTCKHDIGHTISNISIYQELEPGGRQIIISEQKYNSSSSNFAVDINLYELTLSQFSTFTDEDMSYNSLYTIGVLTISSNIGDSTINVSDTVLKYITNPVWFVITLVDGEQSQELGRVTGIDRLNDTITMQNSCIYNFSIGTLIKVDIYLMRNFQLNLLLSNHQV